MLKLRLTLKGGFEVEVELEAAVRRRLRLTSCRGKVEVELEANAGRRLRS